jgi:hypothetical protein
MDTNPVYFANLTAEINGIQGTGACEAMQTLVNKAMAVLQQAVTAIRAKIASLSGLTTTPTDLGSCIAWITDAKTFFVKEFNDATAQLNDVMNSITALVLAIGAAAARLTSCSITVPAVV